MGREARRAPSDWRHPQMSNVEYQPMHNQTFEDGLADHLELGAEEQAEIGRPDPAYYRPAWPETMRTHLQMYETCSEGTPISPVCATAEELARWLADNRTSAFAFADQVATYEQWLATIHRGSAYSAAMGPVGLVSGVAFEMDRKSLP